MLENKKLQTKTIVQTALLIAISLVLRNFSYMVYVGGGAGMRLGVAGFFSKLPAFLFGPVYGGLSSGLVDILGYVIRPDGAYIFPLTLTAALGGVLTGIFYKKIKNASVLAIKTAYFSFLAFALVMGIINYVCLKSFIDTAYGVFLYSFGEKTPFFTYGLFALVLFGLVFYAVNSFLFKKFDVPFMCNYLKIFMVLLPVDLLITTINTFILIAFIPALAKLNFWVFYLPRLAQELVSIFISSYVISYLTELIKKIRL